MNMMGIQNNLRGIDDLRAGDGVVVIRVVETLRFIRCLIEQLPVAPLIPTSPKLLKVDDSELPDIGGDAIGNDTPGYGPVLGYALPVGQGAEVDRPSRSGRVPKSIV